MKHIKVHNLLIHIYIVASALAFITMLSNAAREILFAIGAKSWVICAALGGAGAFNQYVGILAMLWVLSFPILIITSYVFTYKKLYGPFLLITTVDTLISLAWAVNCIIKNDMYAFKSSALDAVVSILFSLALVICLIKEKGQGQPSPL